MLDGVRAQCAAIGVFGVWCRAGHLLLRDRRGADGHVFESLWVQSAASGV